MIVSNPYAPCMEYTLGFQTPGVFGYLEPIKTYLKPRTSGGIWKTRDIYIYHKFTINVSGQITIIPKPEFVGDFGDASLTKPPFGVTSAEVAIICPDVWNIYSTYIYQKFKPFM